MKRLWSVRCAITSMFILAIGQASCSSSRHHGSSSPGPASPGPTLTDPGTTTFLSERPSNPSCIAFAKPTDDSSAQLEQHFNAIALPQLLGLYQAPGSNRWYAVQRTGQITTFTKDDGSDKTTFLDLSGTVNSGPQEGGLLGMAWHPTHPGEFYLSYTIPSPNSPANLRSVIARFKSGDNLTAPNQPEILLTLEQPFENHNGGHLAFGPDGYLYASFGDGGSGGDPNHNAQNINVLFGKILRLDVNNPGAYQIPKDNPFAGRTDAKGEIYAYGLRNTWRFEFDKLTGELWAGDVGQDKIEEVDKIEKGGNYGWNIREANTCYNAASCQTANLIDPVAEYPHDQGQSITGGYVYRGKAIAPLQGSYIFGDFVSGAVWNLIPDANGKLGPHKLFTTGFPLASFAQDQDGELYAIDFNSGKIFKIVPKAGTAKPVTAPAKLSQTGCFKSGVPNVPVDGIIPYEVNSPLWSDGATKRRWLGLPDGKTLDFGDDGHFTFPNGSVLVKEFSLGGKPVETRLFVHHDDGSWAGYSYAWNADGSDADLVLSGDVRKFGDQSWTYPSQGQCLQCHNTNAGSTLGLEIAQLNKTVGPSGGQKNQLDYFDQTLKLFGKALPSDRAALPIPSETTDSAAASRAYLSANCAFCHRPGGTGGGNLDLRYTTAFADTHTCNQTPGEGDLGIADAKVIVPGAPEKSVLLTRLTTRGTNQMPPLASTVVDQDAQKWIEGWIKGLTSCP